MQRIAGIPVSKGGIIGDTLGYLGRHSAYLRELQAMHGDVFYYRTLLSLNLMVLDPLAVDRIFNVKGVSDKDFDLYQMLKSTLGDGLVSIGTNEDWIVRRQMMNKGYKPAGSKESMAFYKQEILDETNRLLNEWEMRGTTFVIDPIAEFQNLAIKVISRIMFGRDIVEGVWTLPQHLNNIIRSLLLYGMVGTRAANLINGKRLRSSTKVAYEAMHQMIQISREAKGEHRMYMIDVLVDMLDSNMITTKQLLDEFVTALSAGYETTTRSLAWALIQIAHNDDVQLKLHQAVDGLTTTVELDKAEYAWWCGREAVRHATPAPGLARRLLEPVQAGNFLLPAGAIVNTSAQTLNTDKRVYGETAELYNPDHYSTLKEIPKAGNLAFGGTTRECAGKLIAEAEMAYTLAATSQRYWFEPIHQQIPALKLGIVLSPDTSKGYHLLRVHRR